MSSPGGDDGEGDMLLPPDALADDFMSLGVEEFDPSADAGDVAAPQSPAAEQNPGNEATQDTTATEQPQQEDDQGAAPMHQETPGPHDAQTQSSDSIRTPSPSGTEPAAKPRGFFDRLFGGNRGRRSSSAATASSTGNVPQRSNTSIASGSRPVSLVEESETPRAGTPSPELVGPSRRRINSRGSGSQEGTGSPPRGGNPGSRAARADTGLSLNTDVADLEAIGANNPTPLVLNRPSPFGLRSAVGNRGSLELTRRNRAFIGLYDQLRSHGIVVNGPDYQTYYDNARGWSFQLDANTLEQLANRGVAGVREVVAAPAANIPVDIQERIIGEAQNGTNAIIDTVNNALADEGNFVVDTANNIITLIDNAPTTQSRQRGTSRASRAESLASNASQPELLPLDPRALMRNTKEDLVNRILNMQRAHQETQTELHDLDDSTRESQDNLKEETEKLKAQVIIGRKRIQRLEEERDQYRGNVEARPRADPPRQDPVDQPPSRDNSEERPQSTRSRSRVESVPRSPERQLAFENVTTLVQNLARHEALLRQLHVDAGLDTDTLDVAAAPFSVNAQLSRTQLGLQLRFERDESERTETRLASRIRDLEAARGSPPGRSATNLFSNLFRSNSEKTESSSGNASSPSGSRAGPATPIQNLADELEARGSGGSPGAAIRQSSGSRRQSVAGSRHSNASSNNSSDYRTPPEGGPAAVNPAPLRAIPEWLATHPNGPCVNCLPVYRFPPELGELPTCGCTCDLALRNSPPPVGSSPRAGSSRSRTGSGRSVRFADDGPAAEGSGDRRPAPLDLSALGNLEESNADRPDTPYPAEAEGGQPGASATGEQAEVGPTQASGAGGSEGVAPASGEQAGAGPTQASGGEGLAGIAPAAGEQAEAVPIQPQVEEAAAVEEPPVEAPPVVVPAGRHGGRCPCCGRGAYGEPPAGGMPQVVYYVCRNVAGQQVPLPGEARPGLLQQWINALGLVPAEPRPAAPAGGDRGDENPAVEPEPPADGPAEAFVPGPGQPARDEVMAYLTMIWNWLIFRSFPLADILLLIHWFWTVVGYKIGMWRLRLGQDPRRFPRVTPFPRWEMVRVVVIILVIWISTLVIAVNEERRIWKVANAHLSAAYFRGVAHRRPYPWYAVFGIDSDLITPAFGRLSKCLHGWHFG